MLHIPTAAALMNRAALQTEKFFDMLGTGSFAALAVGSLLASKSMHARKVSSTQQQRQLLYTPGGASTHTAAAV